MMSAESRLPTEYSAEEHDCRWNTAWRGTGGEKGKLDTMSRIWSLGVPPNWNHPGVLRMADGADSADRDAGIRSERLSMHVI